MTTIHTKPPSLVYRCILLHLLSSRRRRLAQVEESIEHHQATVDQWRIDAQKIRVQIALLEREVG